MNNYNITVGHWNGYTDYNIDIPEDVYFFYRDGAVGNMLKDNCNHYTTIVETEKYKDWIDSLNGFYIDIYVCGKYTIIYFRNIHNDTPIPTIDRQEWFRNNYIDLNQYVFVEYSKNYEILDILRITDFIDPTNVNCIMVNRRKYLYDNEEDYGISTIKIEYNRIESSKYSWSGTIFEIKDGIEANELYNSMINDVLNVCNYDDKYVINYNYNARKNQKFEELANKYENLSE